MFMVNNGVNMVYHIVNKAQLPEVEALWDYCFEKREEPFFKYYFTEYCGKDNLVMAGFEEEKGAERLKTMLHINPYMLRIRGVDQLAPYLVGIATAPEARGRHLLRGLLQACFELLRARGYCFVTLMPIYAGIYLPYEFSFCYEKLRYAWNVGSLDLPRATLSTVTMELEQMPIAEEGHAYAMGVQELVAPIYESLQTAAHAVPKRTPFQWKKLLSVHALENLRCAYVRMGEEICAYMFYRIKDHIFEIQELLAKNEEAKLELLRFVERQRSEADRAIWLAEAWDKTYLFLPDLNKAPQRLPFMMARCVDAREALNRLTPPTGLRGVENNVVLLLTDKLLDRNNHLLKLSLQDGKLDVQSTLEQEQVVMDMAAFTQLYFGFLNATELYEAGRLRCQDTEKLAFLDSLFPKQRNWINEYF